MHPSEQSAANAGALSANHLQQQLQNLNNAVELSLLVGNIQRNGLDDPNFFSTLQRFVPAQSLAISSFPKEANEPVTFWRWQAGMPPSKGTLNLDAAGYQALCQAPRLITSALEELAPNEMELGHAFWQEGSQSILMLPMLVAGNIEGVLHASSAQPQAFHPHHGSILEMVADGLASTVAFLQLQESSSNMAQQQVQLANVQADAKHEIDSLRAQLEEALLQNENLNKSSF